MFNLAVTLKKINNISCNIDTEDWEFLCEMRDYFSFFVDGYKFHPAFKNHLWDGKIALLNINGNLPLGLWSEAEAFCKRHNRTIFIDPSIHSFDVSKELVDTFTESLDVHSGGESITPYDYQKDAVHFALTEGRSVLLAATSSGKSLVIYILLRMYQKMFPDDKFLLVVPSTGLVTQMANDFKDYSSNIDWDIDDYITKVSKGVMEDPSKQFVITTYQSLNNPKTKPPKEFFEQFKAIMVDEVHTAKAKSIQYIMNSAINADFRTGLTGTLDESKTNKFTIMGMFGKIMDVISTFELMEQNRVAQLKVSTAVVKHPVDICKHMRSAHRGTLDKKGVPVKTKADYVEEMSYLTESMERNKFIMRLAIGLEGNTIVMINKIQHGENLFKWMTDTFPDRDIYLYNGDTTKAERERIRVVMEDKENAIIIGSLGVLSTGISIKRLHNMIFAHPSKSRIKVLQSVGRLLRKSKHGNEVMMYDIVDDLSIGAYENYTLDHGRDRVRFYHDQRFDHDTVLIDL